MTSQKIDPRSPTKKEKDARYAALPPLRVMRPLQFINDVTGSYVRDTKGVPKWTPSPDYVEARHAANAGDGATVQRIARRLSIAG